MAAFETPWIMSHSSASVPKDTDQVSAELNDYNSPTTAAFSPIVLSNTSSPSKQRTSILIHQKSSLLLATPPQITRALACSHSFLLPLNLIAGWISWTSGDSWESFLFVVAFWATILYGDFVIKYTAPFMTMVFLFIGLYSREYSSSSYNFWNSGKQFIISNKPDSEVNNAMHQKTLDEIVETLRVFTNRCCILFDPFLVLIDLLSSQISNSKSSKQLLKSLLIRTLIINFVWIILNFNFIQIITTKRTVLVTGTLFLTWHSQPSRATRAIFSRSPIIRRLCTTITGLQLNNSNPSHEPGEHAKNKSQEKIPSPQDSNASPKSSNIQRYPATTGLRFTFVLYENQRKWVGLGWTTSLFASERAAWTDEYHNSVAHKDHFKLPDTEDKSMAWEWVEDSKWLIEGVGETNQGETKSSDSTDSEIGWIYYDNKWQNGRRGLDGWGCFTRRRKWYRDAELVELIPKAESKTNCSASPLASLIPWSLFESSIKSTMRTPISPPSISPPSLSSTEVMNIRGSLRYKNFLPSGRLPSQDSNIQGYLKCENQVTENNTSRYRAIVSSFKTISGIKKTGTVANTIHPRSLIRENYNQTGFFRKDGMIPYRTKDIDWGISDEARMGLE
ncbi:hypothetical protein Golomagni_01188 [Golovinomyces magnicellulatus]|nr:hypothetical protein Golomagni_01188 [Golovinomyces magnicellulatus]